MNDDLRHFASVVYEYREHPEAGRFVGTLFITGLAMVLVSLSAILFHPESNAAPQAPSSNSSPQPAEAATTWASVVAACMRGDQFIWRDPHTGSDFAAFCDVVELGRIVK